MKKKDNKKKVVKKKKKGFTLIELLAVIIILGVIMLIAIPSVTRYINDSRKETYIDTAKQIVKGAIPMVNGGELDVYDTNTTYYIPASCIPTENSMSSPFGEFEDAYVIVVYNGDGYDYYWTSVDSAHQGIEIKEYDKLSKNDVKSNIESIDTTVGIGSRTNIKILDKNECQSFVEGPSSGGNIVYPTGKTKETVEIGDLVTIGTEEFYVVKHDGNNLVLLSRYNLNVGNNKVNEIEGIQNSYCLGVMMVNGTTSKCTISFANINYWAEKVGEGLLYPGVYSHPAIPNTNYPYVYDSNSLLYQPVNWYKNYLEENYGVNIKEARLLSHNEALDLGCQAYQNTCNPFLIETSFWLGSANNKTIVWWIRKDGAFSPDGSYSHNNLFGVRPIIVI